MAVENLADTEKKEYKNLYGYEVISVDHRFR